MSDEPALRFWWQHLRVPLAAFLIAASAFATSSADVAIADTLFFDASRMQWLGAHSWWINEFLHTGGRWLIRGLVGAALVLWVSAHAKGELRTLRRPTAYFTISVVLSVGCIGLLKVLTRIDCPWDLQHFGGRFAYTGLLEALRSDLLGTATQASEHRAACFPAAHASSGYALLALYFVLRERSRRLARLGLACGLCLGCIFGLAQQSRGAHFASHDLWSAFLVWTISLSLYSFAFGGWLWVRPSWRPAGRPCTAARAQQGGIAAHEISPAVDRLAAGGAAVVYNRRGAMARTPRR